MIHVPVLLKETLQVLDPQPGKFMIDGTADGGGHLEALIKEMNEGTVLALDLDKDILERTKERINLKFKISNLKLRILWMRANYADIPEILEREDLGKADGLLLDLGFSTEQLEVSIGGARGFSYKEKDADEPLDMRYNQEEGKTAAEIINGAREDEISDIIFKYGDERFSRYIAKGIVEARKEKRILTVKELVEVIKKSVPKFFKKGEGDVIARTFQALRIYTNGELENLESILKNLPDVMAENGIVAIISFHSLEDRMVKNRFKELADEGRAETLTKKPITASEEEIKANPASRSAKLRAIRIISKK